MTVFDAIGFGGLNVNKLFKVTKYLNGKEGLSKL